MSRLTKKDIKGIWLDKVHYDFDTEESRAIELAQRAVDKALENTVEIPNEKTWPFEWDFIEIRYGKGPCQNSDGLIQTIDRKTPRWRPEIGEVVFVLLNGYITLGTVVELEPKNAIVRVNGEERMASRSLIKKFDLEKVKLAWDEI